MTGAGLLVYALESARIERQVTAQINQEIAEFRALRSDPNTGEPFDDVEPRARRLPHPQRPRRRRDARRLRPTARPHAAHGQPLRPGGPRRARLPGRARRPRRRRRHPRHRVAHLRRDLGDAGARHQRAGRGLAGHRQLPARRARGARPHAADLHARRAALARADHRHRRLPVRPPPGAAAHPRGAPPARSPTTDLSRRIPERGNDDITALTRTINRMLERLDAGVRRAAPVPRRRRPRAQDAAHRPARPPRAARRRRPGRAAPRPGAAARRGRPDVAARAAT